MAPRQNQQQPQQQQSEMREPTSDGRNGASSDDTKPSLIKRLRRSITSKSELRALQRPMRRRRRKRPLVEDHYKIDKENMVLLPGVPAHDDDWARDSHDFFNLIFLVPLVVLNAMNWNWDILLYKQRNKGIIDAWTDEYFDVFWHATMVYFVVDLLWVCIIPDCVKSPATIIQHHIVTLIYILFPYFWPDFHWCMGVCMSVEINTWFLIARRVFNKQGFPPWTIDLPYLFSIRIKLISIFFYLTWVITRGIIYPMMLVKFYYMYLDLSKQVNSNINVLLFVMIIHCAFCFLNAKWTFDLTQSKIRQWKSKEPTKVEKGL